VNERPKHVKTRDFSAAYVISEEVYIYAKQSGKRTINMLIDMHTHLIDYEQEISDKLKADIRRCVSEDTWRRSKQDYIRDTATADKVFVFGIRAKATGFMSCNDRVAAFAKSDPERYTFVASVDPMDADFMDQLKDVHLRLHAKMIKLGPIYQGLHPHDGRYHQIYTYCQQHNLPIITHMATTFASGVPLEYARPALMEQICCEFPSLKVILAHMGHPWEGEAIASIRKQPNMYADISALYYRPFQFYQSMRLLEEYGAGSKVFFGSDYPAATTADTLCGMRSVNNIIAGTALPPVSHELIEGIIYRNPLEILEIA